MQDSRKGIQSRRSRKKAEEARSSTVEDGQDSNRDNGLRGTDVARCEGKDCFGREARCGNTCDDRGNSNSEGMNLLERCDRLRVKAHAFVWVAFPFILIWIFNLNAFWLLLCFVIFLGIEVLLSFVEVVGCLRRLKKKI